MKIVFTGNDILKMIQDNISKLGIDTDRIEVITISESNDKIQIQHVTGNLNIVSGKAFKLGSLSEYGGTGFGCSGGSGGTNGFDGFDSRIPFDIEVTIGGGI